MDTASFFQEAAMRIGSTLELDAGLASLFEFLRDVLPVRGIGFAMQLEENAPVEIIASADASGGRQEQLRLPLHARPTAHYDKWVGYANNRKELQALVRHEGSRAFAGGHSPFGPPPFALLRMVIDHVPSGAFYLQGVPGQPFRPDHVPLLEALHTPCVQALTNCLRYQKISLLRQELARENKALQERLEALCHEDLIGSRGGLKRVMELITHVADTSTPVLVLGESGTGKEVVARTIHSLSRRRDHPFVAINCGALPQDLLESELFGHERGAFTSAVRTHRGRFEQADGGTLFLDEIAELPLKSQASLLRTLQTYEVDRVGGDRPIPVNVRVIAATNRDLRSAVESGAFREDLYYRLAVFPLALPPLRERRQDIPDLVTHFLRRKAARLEMPVPRVLPADMARLMSAPWPGNVRELENYLERSLVLSSGPDLTLAGPELHDSPAIRPDGAERVPTLRELEERHIRDVLARTGGKISGPGGAAELLGLSRHTLYHRLDAMGIPYGRSAGKS